MFSFRTTSIDNQLDKALVDGKVGCFCTQNCWDAGSQRYVYDIFRERGNLEALFIPRGAELTPGTNHIAFDKESLLGLSAVVVEIQDVGSRYFNYTRDVFRLMSALSEMGQEAPAMYVVDHINPAGRVVEGSMPSGPVEEFVPKVAHRHGLTLGELCNLYYSEIGASFPLHIISALAAETTRQLLPWTIAPASDIPGMFTCYMYSGGGLWNNTTITPAIGTARPYEYIGAPFIKADDVASVPVPHGVLMRSCTFTPAAGMYEGQVCNGYQIMLTPEAEYHSLLHTLRLMRYFAGRYSAFEMSDAFYRKLSDDVIAGYIAGQVELDELQDHVKVEEQKWVRKAKRFCLYDDFPLRIK